MQGLTQWGCALRRTSPGGESGEESGGDAGSLVVARLMGGVEYGRPLATGWTGTLGVNWQRAKCLDEHGKALTQVARPGGSGMVFTDWFPGSCLSVNESTNQACWHCVALQAAGATACLRQYL